MGIQLNVTQQYIFQRLHQIEIVQKQGIWLPHELAEEEKTIYELL